MTAAALEALRATREGFAAGLLVGALREAGVDAVTEVFEDMHGPSIATVDATGAYRYLLTRRWGPGAPMTWVMLNPSTATATEDDPTIVRVTHRAAGAGYGALVVVNLFALRATDPAGLRTHPDPVGPGNDACLRAFCQPGDTAVAAWGSHGVYLDRGAEVARMLRSAGVGLLCLGTTLNGQPRHPGRLAYALDLTPWEPA